MAAAAASEIKKALQKGATLVDLRPPDASEAIHSVYTAVAHALVLPFDRAAKTLPIDALPQDKTQPIVLFCRSGARAGLAQTYLAQHGYHHTLNLGGPAGDAQLWSAVADRAHEHKLGVFKQLFDGPSGGGSSTLSYIIGDADSKECVIIDPVLEQVERDAALIEELGLTPTLALNTHCHADHITGTGALKKRFPKLVSAISAASGAVADRKLAPAETIVWGGGARTLQVLATPGHTSGCVTFYDESMGAAFTGDALLIGGCGRTDFQEGSAETLYESVHSRIFTLPPSTLVYPAHDYKGRRASSVATEMASNPRLSKTRAEFIDIMENLNLPYPKKIDASLPANLKCGLD